MKDIKLPIVDKKHVKFVRCIKSETLDYIDIPTASGDDFYFGDEVCKIAHRLNTEHGIISGNYSEYDFWFYFFKQGDDLTVFDKCQGLAAGGVIESGYKGFWFNPDTFEIDSVCDILYHVKTGESEDGFPMSKIVPPDENKSDAFIKEFNNKISKAVAACE